MVIVVARLCICICIYIRENATTRKKGPGGTCRGKNRQEESWEGKKGEREKER